MYHRETKRDKKVSKWTLKDTKDVVQMITVVAGFFLAAIEVWESLRDTEENEE